jgi:hypothetical protein
MIYNEIVVTEYGDARSRKGEFPVKFARLIGMNQDGVYQLQCQPRQAGDEDPGFIVARGTSGIGVGGLLVYNARGEFLFGVYGASPFMNMHVPEDDQLDVSFNLERIGEL